MLLYSNSFDSFENANYILQRIADAIDTKYIQNINEVIYVFAKIQQTRRFDEGFVIGGELRLEYDEHKLEITYVPTSKTKVIISYAFSSSNEPVEDITIIVDLPPHRLGGCHYERLMAELYPYDWYSPDHESGILTIKVPEFLQEQTRKTDYAFPTPDFVLDAKSNWEFKRQHWETIFEKYGYKKIVPIGYSAIWYNPNKEYQYIIFDERGNHSWLSNCLCLLENNNDYPRYHISYRRLIEILEQEEKKIVKIMRMTTNMMREYDEDAEYVDNEE